MCPTQGLPIVCAGLGILDEQIGPAHQGRDLTVRRVVGPGQLAQDAALSPVQVTEKGAVPFADIGARGRPTAKRVALGIFHLDDIATGIGEKLGAIGSCDSRGGIDDPKVRETLHDRSPWASLLMCQQGAEWVPMQPVIIGRSI